MHLPTVMSVPSELVKTRVGVAMFAILKVLSRLLKPESIVAFARQVSLFSWRARIQTKLNIL